MTFNPLNSINDALVVRDIRNQCRTYLTNYTGYIGILRQIYWYFTYYRRAAREGTYRVFLTRNSKNQPVGFGALLRHDQELLVTECVKEKYRGKGYGQAILKKLINIGKREKLVLVAEIRNTNKASIALHEKNKFKLKSIKSKPGFKLRIYKLPATP